MLDCIAQGEGLWLLTLRTGDMVTHDIGHVTRDTGVVTHDMGHNHLKKNIFPVILSAHGERFSVSCMQDFFHRYVVAVFFVFSLHRLYGNSD